MYIYITIYMLVYWDTAIQKDEELFANEYMDHINGSYMVPLVNTGNALYGLV